MIKLRMMRPARHVAPIGDTIYANLKARNPLGNLVTEGYIMQILKKQGVD
jgi:hypothetical protein